MKSQYTNTSIVVSCHYAVSLHRPCVGTGSVKMEYEEYIYIYVHIYIYYHRFPPKILDFATPFSVSMGLTTIL